MGYLLYLCTNLKQKKTRLRDKSIGGCAKYCCSSDYQIGLQVIGERRIAITFTTRSAYWVAGIGGGCK